MRMAAIVFLLGIMTCNQCQTLLPLSYCLFGFVFCSIMLWYWPKLRTLQLLALYVIGFIWAMFCANLQLHASLLSLDEGRPLIAKGVISSLPVDSSRSTSFMFAASRLTDSDHKIISRHIYLNLYWSNPHPVLQVGDSWQLQVRLKRPHGTLNPGSFDLEAWLFMHGVNAVGSVINSQNNHIFGHRAYRYFVDQIREFLDQKMNAILAQDSMRGFIKALTIGVRDNITANQWTVLQSTGTTHLMAISGLHIEMVAGFVALLAAWIWGCRTQNLLRLPRRFAAAMCAWLAALVYSALAGFSIPTVRAVTMLSVAVLCVLRRQHIPFWSAWCLALLAVLITQPFATLDPGFWLSFAAVGVILYGMTGRLGVNDWWWRFGRTQMVATIGLIPLTLLLFKQASIIGFVANFVAIPTVGFCVVPLSLTGCLLLWLWPGIAKYLLLLAAKIMQWLMTFLTMLASLHFASWRHAIYSLPILLTATFGLLLLLAPRGTPGRMLGTFWLLPLFLIKPVRPMIGQVWLSVLDVGQGLATVIETTHHTLVYDTGPGFSPEQNTGTRILAPFLTAQGITHIDTMIISHGDNDHSGGAHALLQLMPTQQVLTSVPAMFLGSQMCQAGQQWDWDHVHFEMLYPPPGRLNLGNDSSCVLKVTIGAQSILLPGDIEKRTEKYLLQKDSTQLASTVLIAPHHGSATSSILPFVSAVHPQWVFFAVGYRNRFRFPRLPVLARYHAMDTQWLLTARSGAIQVKMNGKTPIKITQYRTETRKYWNDQ